MRVEFDLTAENVGEMDSDGAVTRWPTRDCFGGALSGYSRTNVTTKRIDATHFAVIPVGKDTGDLEFVFKVAPTGKAKKDAE